MPIGTTAGPTYPPTATGLSGDCSALLPAYIKVGETPHGNCGISGNGWSTITVPSFKKPTNYYLAMWMADPTVTTFPGSMNLVYKARFGCGGATCSLNFDSKATTCSDGNYTVCLNYGGSAGRWNLVDNATSKASLYTIKTFKSNGATQVGATQTSTNLATNPLQLTLGIVPDGAVFETICATYPTGVSYDISLTPDPTYSGGTGYVQCTDGDRLSGGAPIFAAFPPSINTQPSNQIKCVGENASFTVSYLGCISSAYITMAVEYK